MRLKSTCERVENLKIASKLSKPQLSCYWPDFDETLKVGSWEHLEQIPTIMVTFVQATFDQAIFARIRNIEAVTNQNLFYHKFFGPNIFLNLNFLDPKFFGPKLLWTQLYSSAKFFWQTIFGLKFFLYIICFDLKFLATLIFWSSSFWQHFCNLNF